MPKQARTTNPVIDTAIKEEASQPPLEENSFQLPLVSPPDPRIQALTNAPPDQEYDYTKREVSMIVFGAEKKIEKHFQNTAFNLLI